jgi:hypothetical protein
MNSTFSSWADCGGLTSMDRGEKQRHLCRDSPRFGARIDATQLMRRARKKLKLRFGTGLVTGFLKAGERAFIEAEVFRACRADLASVQQGA